MAATHADAYSKLGVTATVPAYREPHRGGTVCAEACGMTCRILCVIVAYAIVGAMYGFILCQLVGLYRMAMGSIDEYRSLLRLQFNDIFNNVLFLSWVALTVFIGLCRYASATWRNVTNSSAFFMFRIPCILWM